MAQHPETQREGRASEENRESLEADVDHLCRMLKAVIRASDRTGKEMERELGMSPGYLSRLLGGGIEVKLSHLFHVLALAGMPPHELFHAAFPPTTTEPSPVLQRLLQAAPEAWAGALPPSPQLDPRELEEKLGVAVREVLAGFENKAAGSRRRR